MRWRRSNSAASLPGRVDLSALIASGRRQLHHGHDRWRPRDADLDLESRAANLDSRAGRCATNPYMAQVNDGHAMCAQPLTVTITGTNDAPVVAGRRPWRRSPRTAAPADHPGRAAGRAVDVDSPSLTAANLTIASGLVRSRIITTAPGATGRPPTTTSAVTSPIR